MWDFGNDTDIRQQENSDIPKSGDIIFICYRLNVVIEHL